MENIINENKNKKMYILLICFIIIIVLIGTIYYIINLDKKESNNNSNSNNSQEKDNSNKEDNSNEEEDNEDGVIDGVKYKDISDLVGSEIKGNISLEEKNTILNLYTDTLVALRCTKTNNGNCFPTVNEMVLFALVRADAERELDEFDATKTYKSNDGLDINLNDYVLYDAKKIKDFIYKRFAVNVDFNSYVLEGEYYHSIPSLGIIVGEEGGGRAPIYIKSAKVEVKNNIYTLFLTGYDYDETPFSSEMTLKKIKENNTERFIYTNFKH